RFRRHQENHRALAAHPLALLPHATMKALAGFWKENDRRTFIASEKRHAHARKFPLRMEVFECQVLEPFAQSGQCLLLGDAAPPVSAACKMPRMTRTPSAISNTLAGASEGMTVKSPTICVC